MTDALDRHSEAAIRTWLEAQARERRKVAVFVITVPAGDEICAGGADFEICVIRTRSRLRVLYAEEIDRNVKKIPAAAALMAKICARVRDPARKIVRFDDLQVEEDDDA